MHRPHMGTSCVSSAGLVTVLVYFPVHSGPVQVIVCATTLHYVDSHYLGIFADRTCPSLKMRDLSHVSEAASMTTATLAMTEGTW